MRGLAGTASPLECVEKIPGYVLTMKMFITVESFVQSVEPDFLKRWVSLGGVAGGNLVRHVKSRPALGS